MSNKRRTRRASNRRQLILSVVILAELVLLFVVLSSACGRKKGSDEVPPAAPSRTEVAALPTAPAETAAPEIPQPAAEPARRELAWAANELLPIYRSAATDEKVIAITVDDCFQMDNLNRIMDCASSHNAKITIFPIGYLLESASAKETLRRAFSLGYEIENHTYSHSRLYGVSDREMAENIYLQNLMVNNALDLNYEMHFFRAFGGNGESCPRMNAYLKKLGYSAIAHWSCSGSDRDFNAIKRKLQPGAIFLFHTTKEDVKKLEKLIPYAISEGYRLVTLNELFGMEPNRVSPRTTNLDSPVPAPDEYAYTEYIPLKPGDKGYPVQLVQERLAALNYLASFSDADGDFGEKTLLALQSFQKLCGLPADGDATVETQRRLFADDAPNNAFFPHPTARPAEHDAAV